MLLIHIFDAKLDLLFLNGSFLPMKWIACFANIQMVAIPASMSNDLKLTRDVATNTRKGVKKMAKKKHKKYTITSAQIFDATKPQFNGFSCGYGAHGKRGYDRNKQKRDFQKQMFL